MKFSIEKIELKNMLIYLQPFLDKRDLSQISSHIFFKVQKDKLILKATDYEIGLKIENDKVIIKKDGIATANGKQLLDIVKILQNETIYFEVKKNFLVIKQEHSIFKLPMFEAKEYPKFPTLKNKKSIKVDNLKLLKATKKVVPAIDIHNPKFELHGALIEIKNSHAHIVSTDGKRLSLVEFDSEIDEKLSLIIHKKALIEIQKIFFDEVEIFFDEVDLIVKSKEIFFFTKLINGNFPNFEKILLKNSNYKLKLPKDNFIEEINLVTAISNEIKLTFSKNKIIFEAFGEDTAYAKSEFEFNTNLKEDLIIGVNSKYLLDFLTSIESEDFNLEINGEITPFMVISKNFKTVITPIII